MIKSLLSVAVLIATLVISSSCTSEPTTQIAQADLSVQIEASENSDGKVVEMVAEGQTIILKAEPSRGDVTFKWTLTGLGALSSDSDPIVQYTAPQSVPTRKDVNVRVEVTQNQTTLSAKSDITLHLLPQPTPSAQPQPTELNPQETSTVSTVTTSLPTDTPAASTRQTILRGFTGANSCPGANPVPGTVRFDNPGSGSLHGTIELTGLQQEYVYTLSLNEQPGFPGELGSCARSGQAHCDFQDIVTDATGNVQTDIQLELPPGSYHLKFFVKDANRSFCVLLYNDNFQFDVQ